MRLGSGGTTQRRVLAAVIVVLTALLCSLWSLPYRSIEAMTTGRLLGLLTSSSEYSDHYGVAKGSAWQWFRVTTECTSAVLLVPIAIVGAWMVCQRRVRIERALAGFAIGWLIVAGASTFRLLLIGLNYHFYGMSSFWVTHNMVGSLISLASTIAALFAQIRISTAGSEERARSFGPPQGSAVA